MGREDSSKVDGSDFVLVEALRALRAGVLDEDHVGLGAFKGPSKVVLATAMEIGVCRLFISFSFAINMVFKTYIQCSSC